MQIIKCAYKTITFRSMLAPLFTCDIFGDLINTERHVAIKTIASAKSTEPVTHFHAIGKTTHFVPDFTPLSSAIVAITLERCKVMKLKKDDLKPYPKLAYLQLLKNKLRVLDRDVFENTPELVFIDMNHNMLKEIVPGAFDGLVSLKELHLMGNECVHDAVVGRTAVVAFVKDLKDKCEIKFRATIVARKRDQEHRRKTRERTSLWVTFGVTFGSCVVTMSIVVGMYLFKARMVSE
jgi:hypothetical protein